MLRNVSRSLPLPTRRALPIGLSCLVGLVVALGAGRTGAAPKAVDIKPALGKKFPDYEKVLGKAVKTEKAPNGEGEVRSYKLAGFAQVMLTDASGSGVSQALFGFPKKEITSWKQAFAMLSLPTAGVSLTKSEEYYTVNGLPNGWEAAWAPNNPDTGTHVLYLYPMGQ